MSVGTGQETRKHERVCGFVFIRSHRKRVQREEGTCGINTRGIKEGDIKHMGAVMGSSCGEGDQIKLCRKTP